MSDANKPQRIWKPYSYKGRVVLMLILCCLLAAPITFLAAYGVSHYNMRDQLSETEHDMAIYLLELEQKTDLPMEDMLRMAAGSELSIAQVAEEDTKLTSQQLRDLEDRLMLTVTSGINELPITYVYLGGEIVRIRTATGNHLLVAALLRILLAVCCFLLCFFLAVAIAAKRIFRPITQLTKATRQVAAGDFTVRLPETGNDELGELTRSFNGMTDNLARTEYLQKDFISGISHEFKTPIASIRGFARMLQMPSLPEDKRQEYIALIAEESDRLSRLSGTLLRLSSLEQRTVPAEADDFSLDEQLRQVVLQLEPAWEKKEIDWQLELGKVTLRSDPELLWQVWSNLLQNAVKFSEQGGAIALRLYMADCVVVEIEDHGIGMTEDVTARIFDRFYQAESSRSREGVGLGLCLVKRIVDMLGGTIRVRSVPGMGSTFSVRLPLQPPTKASAKEEQSHGDRG